MGQSSTVNSGPASFPIKTKIVTISQENDGPTGLRTLDLEWSVSAPEICRILLLILKRSFVIVYGNFLYALSGIACVESDDYSSSWLSSVLTFSILD
jgi:hypothetical protein